MIQTASDRNRRDRLQRFTQEVIEVREGKKYTGDVTAEYSHEGVPLMKAELEEALQREVTFSGQGKGNKLVRLSLEDFAIVAAYFDFKPSFEVPQVDAEMITQRRSAKKWSSAEGSEEPSLLRDFILQDDGSFVMEIWAPSTRVQIFNNMKDLQEVKSFIAHSGPSRPPMMIGETTAQRDKREDMVRAIEEEQHPHIINAVLRGLTVVEDVESVKILTRLKKAGIIKGFDKDKPIVRVIDIPEVFPLFHLLSHLEDKKKSEQLLKDCIDCADGPVKVVLTRAEMSMVERKLRDRGIDSYGCAG